MASNFELADLTGKVGRPEEALAAHRAVLAAREARAAEPESGAAAKVDLGQSLTAVASLLEATGKADEAVTTYRRSESLLAGLAGGDPAARAALADCRSRLGDLLGNRGRVPEALAALRQAAADQQALADAPGATEAIRRDHAMTHRRLSLLLSEKLQQKKEAEAEARTALTLWQELADDKPDVPEYRYRLGGAHGNLALLLSYSGRQADVEAEYRKVEEIFRKLVTEYPAVIDFRAGLATLHLNRGLRWFYAGRSAEAEADYRAALAIDQSLADHSPAVERFRLNIGYNYINISVLLRYTRPAEAEVGFRRAVAILQKLSDDNPKNLVYLQGLVTASMGLCTVLRTLGRKAEARDLLEQTARLAERLAQEGPTPTYGKGQLAFVTRLRGWILGDQGDHAAAAAHARRALELFTDISLKSNSHMILYETALCHAALAGLAGRAGSGVAAAEATAEADAAMALLRQAVAMGLRNPALYNAESALAPLRDRPDFRLLMMDLAFPTDPLAAAR
jgi:tetratricopeptide (TPR) repeat protein